MTTRRDPVFCVMKSYDVIYDTKKALSEGQEASFIELYGVKSPCLYDVNSKSYINEIEKRNAVDEIAE